jgi:hypothetical protein
MYNKLKKILIIIPEKLKRTLFVKRNEKIYLNWEKQGKPIPPPSIVKRKTIEYYKNKHKLHILIETGTYLGDTVWYHLNNFDEIYSIELSGELWKRATKQFKNSPHVKLLKEDNGIVLASIIPKIKEKSLFWLDGHYSEGITAKGDKETPIMNELNIIFESDIKHVILIDDARMFIGKHDYPTIKELSEYILLKKPNSIIEIENDIIRIELK